MSSLQVLEMRVQSLEAALSAYSEVLSQPHLAPELIRAKPELWEVLPKPGLGSEEVDVSAYTNLKVPVYHRAADVSVKSAAIAASTKYWIEVDEDYNSGAGQVTLETGAAWGTPSDSVSVFRILETDADKVAKFYRMCWVDGEDLRAADITETTV